ELLDASEQRVYFLRYGWNRLWWQTLRPAGARLFIITVRDGCGRLAGLAPFYLRERRTAGIPHVRELMFIGTGIYAQTGEYLDLIARRGDERMVAEAVAALLLRSDDWDRLCLNEIPAASLVLPHLREALGPGAELHPGSRAHFITTTGNWEDVLANLSGSTRKNLSYETRRLFRAQACRLRRVADAAELEAALDALVRLHQARWNARGEPGSFSIPGFEGFLREAARLSLRDGRLRMWTLEADGAVAAALIGFYDNGIVHYLQAGFDPQFARFSIGRVMLGLCIRECATDKTVRVLDFMGGNNAYKDEWTQAARETVALTCLRPGVRAMAYTGMRRVARLSKSLLKAALPSAVRVAGLRLLQRRYFYR
ncbi:MAG TPA: GNAT family N-acetyltransferase, partial [Blastocatellia bacterium]|nr:GNAT family N-acetyltransferase [Blastocatellia bacterium]